MNPSLTSTDRVQRCRQTLSHVWMVRTFIKHAEESEDFPELMQMARAAFDLCRALDERAAQPEEYLRILRKKLGKFRSAVRQFALDAPLASTHINFEQAVLSIQSACEDLEQLAAEGDSSPAVPSAGS